METCKYKSKDGHCTKYRKNGKCMPSSVTWCDEPIETIAADRMCEHSSIFGNDYVFVTEEQIKELYEGKALCIPINAGEYECFVALRKEN